MTVPRMDGRPDLGALEEAGHYFGPFFGWDAFETAGKAGRRFIDAISLGACDSALRDVLNVFSLADDIQFSRRRSIGTENV